MPPVLILHGSDDRRVPVLRARELQGVLKKFGAPHEIQIYEGQPHVFAPATMLDAAERAVNFFDHHLRHPANPA
jgi:dipeptidyl aminopeptidase/acylaminoacyl peptidase